MALHQETEHPLEIFARGANAGLPCSTVVCGMVARKRIGIPKIRMKSDKMRIAAFPWSRKTSPRRKRDDEGGREIELKYALP